MRQHPVAAITRAADLIRENLVTIIAVMAVGAGGSEGGAFVYWFAGLFVFLLVAGIAGWWRFQYRVNEGELQIKQGIFVRKNLYLTQDRIQVIDITAGVIQRIFGLVSVDVKTAGASSRAASLSAVTRHEANRVVELLRNGRAGRQEDTTDTAPAPETRMIMPLKDLLIAASTSGSFGIALSILATIFSQIEPLISDSAIFDWIASVIPSEADSLLIAGVLALFVLFAWLMSFFGTVIRYGDFSLTIAADELVIRSGLLEKKRVTVPFNRIQAVRIVEGIMRQPFGYATIQVESAGYGDKQGSGSVVLFPLMKLNDINPFLAQILPEYCANFETVSPPGRSLTRYMIRSSALIAFFITALWLLLDVTAWIWLLLATGLLLGWLRYRDAAIGADKDKILIRSRLLARTTAIIQRNRAQDMTVRSSIVQRFRKLANIDVHVASGDQGKGFRVRELDEETAFGYLPWITAGYMDRTGGKHTPNPAP